MVAANKDGVYKTRVFPGSVKVRVCDLPRPLYKEFEAGSDFLFTVSDKVDQMTLDPIGIPRLTKVSIRIRDENKKPITGYRLVSRFEGRRYGPVSGDLGDDGVVTVGVSRYFLNELGDANYFGSSRSKVDQRCF